MLPLVYMMMAVVDGLGGIGLSASSSGASSPLWQCLDYKIGIAVRVLVDYNKIFL